MYRQIGEPHNTIIGVLRSEVVDIDTLILLYEWLGVSPSSVLDSMVGSDKTLANQNPPVLHGLQTWKMFSLKRLNV